ncbi:YceD family protein [Bradyrhizobium sp. STM 3557]|uniref:YceD family protein n=1 Tax=Bradyrhizobium sp. STM 3557 TaxID=578920 RepID=UPI003890D424
MSRNRDLARDKDPWRAAPVIVAQIPEAGLHRELQADVAARNAMAAIAGLREIVSAQAAFDLTLKPDGKVHVIGRVRARVGQECVVTLDPVENEIDEPVDLIFAPPEQIPQLADLVDDDPDDDAEVPDPPEPIVNGQIDLGRIATDALFLGIDPYPRKQGAVFEAEIEAKDPEDHPFAALKVLRSQGAKKGDKE